MAEAAPSCYCKA